MSVYLAEYIGTLLLILLGNGAVATAVLKDSKGLNGGWIAITWGWGMAVMVAVFVAGRISGAHINPAVTLALVSIGGISPSLVPGYLLAQMAGAMSGAALVYLAYLPHWKRTESAETKRACFCTSPAVRSPVANFVTECIGTAVLIFGVLGIGSVANNLPVNEMNEGLKQVFSSWFGPLAVGLLVLSIGLSLGGSTGYAINPARDLGPRLVHALLPIPGKGGNDWKYAWIPVLAPITGGVLAAQAYVLCGF